MADFLIEVPEAAQILGVSERDVRLMIRQEVLRAFFVPLRGQAHQMMRSEVLALRDQREAVKAMEDVTAAENLVSNVKAMSQTVADLTGEPVKVDLTVGSNLGDPVPGDLWRGRLHHAKRGGKPSVSHVFRARSEVVSIPDPYGNGPSKTKSLTVILWRSLCGRLQVGPTHSPDRDATPPHCGTCKRSLDAYRRKHPEVRVVVEGYTTWTFMPNEDGPGSGGGTAWSLLGTEASNAEAQDDRD